MAQVRVRGEPARERGDARHADAVLRHAHLLERAVRLERGRPRLGGAVLETVAPADDRAQVRLHFGFRVFCTGVRGEGVGEASEGVGDDGAACGAETVVVELEDAKGARGREEGHERVDGAPAEGVIREVDLDERGLADERVADRGECGRDLGDEAAGEDVGEVSNLRMWGARGQIWEVGARDGSVDLETVRDDIKVVTHPKLLGLCEELCKGLSSLNTNGVSSEMDLLDDSGVGLGEVGFYVCPGIEFQALAEEREYRHGIVEVVKGRVRERGGLGEQRKRFLARTRTIVRSKSEISLARAEILISTATKLTTFEPLTSDAWLVPYLSNIARRTVKHSHI